MGVKLCFFLAGKQLLTYNDPEDILTDSDFYLSDDEEAVTPEDTETI